MKTKRLAVIGSVGIPANYGGFETLTEHLVKRLSNKYNITVYCSKKKYSKEQRIKEHLGARLKYLPLDANGMQSIAYDSLSIIHALFYADVLLILGVAGAWLLPFIKLFTNKKVIISIDGIEWKREKWNLLAKWYLWWAEKMAVKYSHADISDNESIQEYTAVRYGTLSQIIEYGADHTLSVKPTTEDKEEFTFLNKPYAFKVCRIEPENNVHMVLEAFAKMPRFTLVMVGNWNNSQYGKNLKANYGKYANILLLDPIYNQRKLDLLRGNAYLYVHGHSAGGTNPSLVEAMYLGLPILTFDVSYNRTTTESSAIYFKTVENIIHIVETTRLSTYLEKGKKMQEIAHRRYNWDTIADKYDALMQRVLQNKPKAVLSPVNQRDVQKHLIENGMAHFLNQSLFFEKR